MKLLKLFKNHTRVKFICDGVGEEQFHTIRFNKEIEELEKALEFKEAVEWALMHKPNWIEHYKDELYIFGTHEKYDEVPLLEAYRQSQKGE